MHALIKGLSAQPKINRRQLAAGTCVAAVLALLASTGVPATAAETKPLDPNDPYKVTLGTIPIAPLIPAFIAMEQGWFKEEGLDVELKPEPGGQDIVTAVVAQEFDFGFSNQTSLLIARSRGLPISAFANGVVGSPDVASAWDGLIVRNDSPIKEPKDLIGKTVSVNTLNNTPHMVLLKALENAGIENPERQITFIEVQFPDAVGAVSQGRVDAAWVVEPFVTVGRMFGDTRIVMHLLIETAPSFLMSAYFTSDKLIAERPDVVAAFARAINRAMKYASENPQVVRDSFPKFNENANPKVAQAMALPFWKFELSAADFEMGAELAKRYGFIDEVPDLEAFVKIPE
ncbi:ABC transporter substrate-binding protein [Polymorphum gilvum]|uniref:ABC-type nitrate/sulfonate/bicarbonate transport systems periplasmic components-like protein n=1 Tax=Polymorphum gilvum (strain LMG 25793 / CGMCC 1.9160 / SL003B-26A1) TaxID=991905 RepID=F2IZI6_POLGS|nr:ABC transporter substrate-binding protein [Polymorphum gilvum]ADZ69543.1 ABC-type nitrate/sulfonate/bicarbonate transport systems periplasmic components-like protein [Polymorphum gilvum SL003B-26A1]